MEFKKLNGYSEEGSSYISLDIEGGNNNDSIGDQVWISNSGNKMEISETCDEDVFIEAINLFTGNSKRSFRGAMIRMGVDMPNIY